MERFISILGIAVFFGIAYLLSVDRQSICWRTCGSGNCYRDNSSPCCRRETHIQAAIARLLL